MDDTGNYEPSDAEVKAAAETLPEDGIDNAGRPAREVYARNALIAAAKIRANAKTL